MSAQRLIAAAFIASLFCIACSEDDGGANDDGAGATGGGAASGPTTGSSGATGTSTSAAAGGGPAECVSCSDVVVQEENPSGLCTEGSPSSKSVFDALMGCICDPAAGKCTAPCGDSLCAGALDAGSECFSCVTDQCNTELGACQDD